MAECRVRGWVKHVTINIIVRIRIITRILVRSRVSVRAG